MTVGVLGLPSAELSNNPSKQSGKIAARELT
jgi:hypothetical protein